MRDLPTLSRLMSSGELAISSLDGRRRMAIMRRRPDAFSHLTHDQRVNFISLGLAHPAGHLDSKSRNFVHGSLNLDAISDNVRCSLAVRKLASTKASQSARDRNGWSVSPGSLASKISSISTHCCSVDRTQVRWCSGRIPRLSGVVGFQ